jgi:hypothetical protein
MMIYYLYIYKLSIQLFSSPFGHTILISPATSGACDALDLYRGGDFLKEHLNVITVMKRE